MFTNKSNKRLKNTDSASLLRQVMNKNASNHLTYNDVRTKLISTGHLMSLATKEYYEYSQDCGPSKST
jgi:hypothetical protein